MSLFYLVFRKQSFTKNKKCYTVAALKAQLPAKELSNYHARLAKQSELDLHLDYPQDCKAQM